VARLSAGNCQGEGRFFFITSDVDICCTAVQFFYTAGKKDICQVEKQPGPVDKPCASM
jgi:hypothetical protein